MRFASLISDFSIEHSKSNRAACKYCGSKIDKGVVRAVFVDHTVEDMGWHSSAAFQHLRCSLKPGGKMTLAIKKHNG